MSNSIGAVPTCNPSLNIFGIDRLAGLIMRLPMLRPTTSCTGYNGEGARGDLTNLNVNCPNTWDIPYNQIPLQKVGDYCGFDAHGLTVQY